MMLEPKCYDGHGLPLPHVLGDVAADWVVEGNLIII